MDAPARWSADPFKGVNVPLWLLIGCTHAAYLGKGSKAVSIQRASSVLSLAMPPDQQAQKCNGNPLSYAHVLLL
jgi:hypothetical protein